MFNDSGGLQGIFEGADAGQLVFIKNFVEGNETSVCQVSLANSLMFYADQMVYNQTDYRVPEKVL